MSYPAAYTCDLSFWAECSNDIYRVLSAFYESKRQGIISTMVIHENFMYPECEVNLLQFSVMPDVEGGASELMSQTIEFFLDSVEKTNGANVISETLNYREEYNGKRHDGIDLKDLDRHMRRNFDS